MSTSLMRPALANRLKGAVEGDVLVDAYSRGRYATDASIYQVMPAGVVVPKNANDVAAALAIAGEEGLAVTARGGGTSQCGQTVNESLIVDTSKHLNRILELDLDGRRAVVEPGVVLDELNRVLKPYGLWYPVDVSTASRATLGGMASNNSCGGRSLRYGTMRNNVLSIDATLADGRSLHFGPVDRTLSGINETRSDAGLFRDLLALGEREAEEIAQRFPDVPRRVGGYNIDALAPNGATNNLAHLLVGSEGTLGFFNRIELKLSPLPGAKVMGVCHFGSFYAAMDAAQHLVALDPMAVELVDRTMIALARDIAMFQPTLDAVVRGDPDAVLVVEFSEADAAGNTSKLAALADLMADLGFAFSHGDRTWGGVVDVVDPALQAALTEVRKAGLNIMMSMKQEGKPVSFVEDCAVPLPDLADYTDRLTRIFEKHGTTGTWYAHASVGCLHVRPVLNLKLDQDVKAMRAIAEEAFDMVLAYKGSHSGEHGDGIVRSEFHEKMFGPRMIAAFKDVKIHFDPDGRFNPGRIVDPPAMDDRTLFRYHTAYQVAPFQTELDWSAYPGEGGGFQGAVEMCNNNGACRKLAGGAMCPSYRATRNERDLVRGRANTLRLAISGQLGPDAMTSDAMQETMKLCVSCKACRRECPTGVDMARMKIEISAARVKKHGLPLHDRLVAYLPHYAPLAARLRGLANLRDLVPGLATLSEWVAKFDARRTLPVWRKPFSGTARPQDAADDDAVVLFVDTFNRYFEPATISAAIDVLEAAGFGVHLVEARDGKRPLCCGRTFLSAGLIDAARAEARRTADALLPFAERGLPILGLEPSCLFTFRDEFTALLPKREADLLAGRALLIEEFLAERAASGTLNLPLEPLGKPVALHGHCHQKAFGALGAVEQTLRLIPDLELKTIESSCCGMAGAFGYHAETYDVSKDMAELALLPAVRAASDDTLIVADGTSCRHQIKDGAARDARHVVHVLKQALGTGRE
ncbi:MAG: FAD-linked oxidase C-terminal domain-containing protein [Pseudomonadota bacterium]